MTESEQSALLATYTSQKIPIEELKHLSTSGEKRAAKINNTKKRTAKIRKMLDMANDQFISFQGSPCLEPFKTMHVSFDGRIRPCCFSGTQDWIENVNRVDAKSIWDGPIYQTLRENIIQNKYHKDMCSNCLKKSSYPKHHHLQTRYEIYKKWYRDRYREDIPYSLNPDPSTIATPPEILAKQALRRSDH